MVQNGLQDRTYYNPGHQHFYFIRYSKHPHVRTHDFWVQADLVLVYQAFSEKSEGKCYLQGAKKIIFTACHSGKLKLTFTSPDVISTSPKAF